MENNINLYFIFFLLIYQELEEEKTDLNKNYYMIDISRDLITGRTIIEDYSSGTLKEILKALDEIKTYAIGILYTKWKQIHYNILDLYLLYYKEEHEKEEK